MKHFFYDSLVIYTEQSRDEYGRESWGTGEAVMGRFVEKSKLLYSPKGEAVMSDALIHVASGVSLAINTRVVFESVNYRVMKINKPKDTNNVRFIKAYLERLDDV